MMTKCVDELKNNPRLLVISIISLALAAAGLVLFALDMLEIRNHVMAAGVACVVAGQVISQTALYAHRKQTRG